MIVLDTSVLSAFTILDKLPLIKDLFGEVIIPYGVFEEYTKRWSSEKVTDWINIETIEEENIMVSPFLGLGESQAIILAQSHDCILALDDEKARDTARNMGVTLIGSIGILRLAYEMCLIDSKTALRGLVEKLEEDLYIEKWLHDWALEAEK